MWYVIQVHTRIEDNLQKKKTKGNIKYDHHQWDSFACFFFIQSLKNSSIIPYLEQPNLGHST